MLIFPLFVLFYYTILIINIIVFLIGSEGQLILTSKKMNKKDTILGHLYGTVYDLCK